MALAAGASAALGAQAQPGTVTRAVELEQAGRWRDAIAAWRVVLAQRLRGFPNLPFPRQKHQDVARTAAARFVARLDDRRREPRGVGDEEHPASIGAAHQHAELLIGVSRQRHRDLTRPGRRNHS